MGTQIPFADCGDFTLYFGNTLLINLYGVCRSLVESAAFGRVPYGHETGGCVPPIAVITG